jgi:HPt (histidine-containing phosphotransfer) domain-containing protein
MSPRESDFSAASIARTALEFACQKFEQEMKPSKLSKFGIKRKSARATANELLQQNIAEDFDGLQNLVNQLECQWDDSHGPASTSCSH